MDGETGTDTPTEEIVEEEVTQGETSGTESKDGDSKEGTGNGGKDGVADWQKRYKELQSLKDKQLSEMEQKLKERDSGELKAKLSDLESKLNDPDYLVRRYEEAKRKAEEEESLTPEAKEIRRIQKEWGGKISSMEMKFMERNALDAYKELRESDEFFKDKENENKIVSMISKDPSVRQMVLQNPEKTYRILKGLIVSEDQDWEAKMEARILEKQKIQAEEAKKKKTSMTSPNGSGTTAKTKAVGSRDISELVAEFNARNKKT